MSLVPRLPILVALASLAVPANAEFCKWVDADGVVHYAETCPEGVAGSTVRTEPPPSAEQVEAAVRRAEEMLAERQVRKASAARDSASKIGAAQAMAAAVAPGAVCDDAFRAREILAMQLPVYYDDLNRLYYRDSLHHHWYAGPRIYLDDEARNWEAGNNERYIAEQCAGFEPSRPGFVVRFIDAPNLRETIGLLENHGSPLGPPGEDVCRFAEKLLQDIGQDSTDIPSDGARHLEGLIGRHCR